MWSAAAEVKIGLMHALSGSMQSRETPLYLAELIAIEEINARGGLLGRMVEPSAGSQGVAACTLRPERGSTRSSCFMVAGGRKFRWSPYQCKSKKGGQRFGCGRSCASVPVEVYC